MRDAFVLPCIDTKTAIATPNKQEACRPRPCRAGPDCAMMAGYTLAEAIDHAGEVTAGIAQWQHREQPVTEWIQQVACWYGRLALLSPTTRTLTFRVLARSKWLRDATLFFAAGRDPTAPEYWYDVSVFDDAHAWPLVH
jgi:hypothetical protein